MAAQARVIVLAFGGNIVQAKSPLTFERCGRALSFAIAFELEPAPVIHSSPRNVIDLTRDHHPRRGTRIANHHRSFRIPATRASRVR